MNASTVADRDAVHLFPHEQALVSRAYALGRRLAVVMSLAGRYDMSRLMAVASRIRNSRSSAASYSANREALRAFNEGCADKKTEIINAMTVLPPLCSYAAVFYYSAMKPMTLKCEAIRFADKPGLVTEAGESTSCWYQFPEMPGNPSCAKYKAMCINGEWRFNPKVVCMTRYEVYSSTTA